MMGLRQSLVILRQLITDPEGRLEGVEVQHVGSLQKARDLTPVAVISKRALPKPLFPQGSSSSSVRGGQ